MAYRTNSRTAPGEHREQSAPSTLQDVLHIVLVAPTLSARARQDRASAIRTIARLSNRPLSMLDCDVKSVRRLLVQIVPARHGMSSGRWSNVKSLVFRSLDLAKVARAPGRSNAPILDSWKGLLAPLPYHPFHLGLIPLARFCSERGIVPGSVDQSTFDTYERQIEELSSRARPRDALLNAIRAWNKAGQLNESWPPFRARLETRRKDYSLPWDAFPQTLKADIDAMVNAALRPDLFDPGSPKPIKKITGHARVRMLRALASALVHQGRDPDQIDSIRALVEVERVKTALAWIYERIGKRKTTHLRNFANTVCVVAQHWVGVSQQQLDALKGIRRQLDPKLGGMTEKNRATLRLFEDEQILDRFLGLPERIWRHFCNKTTLKLKSAVELQTALAVELLTVAPVRIKNLSAARLDANIIDHGSGRHRSVHLYFPTADVKNEVELEFQLPASTVALLDRYVSEVRPLLVREPNSFLFPGKGANPKSGTLLSAQAAQMMEREVGVRVTAHQFRHLAGYIYLRANPGGHEVIRRLLGHKSIETTLRFYAGMEAADAVRHYDAHIALRRAKLMRRGAVSTRGAFHGQ